MASRRLFGLVVLAAGLALVALGAGTGSVAAADPPAPAPLHVSKIISGPTGVTLPTYTADFPINLDCGSDGTYTETATGTTIPTIPGPAVAAVFTGIPLGAFCTMTEGTLPDPPDGFAWADAIYGNGTKVTIGPSDTQLHVENPLVAEGLWVSKLASTDPDGPFTYGFASTFTGRTVYFRVTVRNLGDMPLTGVTLTDDQVDLSTTACDPPATLAAGDGYVCTYSVVAVTGTTINVVTADSAETEPTTSTATYVANPVPPDQLLTVSKTTNARKAFLDMPSGPDVVVSTADQGDTITYTLKYKLETDIVQWLVLVDVLPDGVTYVPFSATANSEIFPNPGPEGEYDPVARSLTWTTRFQTGGLGTVTQGGSVSYQVTVDEDAASLPQPLRNVATISSTSTPEFSADHLLFVGPLPAGVHFAPDPTAPATDAVEASGGGGSGPGVGLLLVVLGLAGLVGGSVLVGRVPGARGVARR